MSTKPPLAISLIALSWLSVAACGQASPQARSDPAPGLLAMAPLAAGSPSAARLPAPAPEPANTPRVSDDVLHDPAERFAFMQRLRTHVVHKTRQVPNDRWWNQVRPMLRVQLQDAGLARGDVDFLLWEIDQSKIAASR